MHITPEIHVVVEYQNSLTGTNTPSGPGGGSTSETSVAAAETFCIWRKKNDHGW